jgi:hypothetical protein
MRARVTVAVALAGLAVCVASDVYLEHVDPASSGLDFLLVGWNWLPFLLLAGVFAVSRVSLPAAALATLLMGALVVALFWAEASDVSSSDPSSTGAIALAIGPFYDLVIISVVCGLDVVARKLAKR